MLSKVESYKEVSYILLESHRWKCKRWWGGSESRPSSLMKRNLEKYHQIFTYLRVEEAPFYCDERVIVTNYSRHPIINTLQKWHQGRDAMLALVAGIWWLNIPQQTTIEARFWKENQNAGKNFRFSKRQSLFEKSVEGTEQNQKLALVFVCSYLEATKSKEYSGNR